MWVLLGILIAVAVGGFFALPKDKGEHEAKVKERIRKEHEELEESFKPTPDATESGFAEILENQEDSMAAVIDMPVTELDDARQKVIDRNNELGVDTHIKDLQ